MEVVLLEMARTLLGFLREVIQMKLRKISLAMMTRWISLVPS
jgi:hypothetical protein